MASVDILSPVGRIVQGHPMKAQQKTDNNDQPLFKDGKPVMQWWFALAIPKAEWQPISVAMGQAAADIVGNQNPKFAWKFKDGDVAVDSNGKPYRDKPGMAGCMILYVTTEFQQPTVSKLLPGGQFGTMTAEEIKTGHFVRVFLNIVGHPAANAAQTPGLYVNPRGIEWIAYGEEIVTGPDVQEMFGTAPRPAVLPPGASTTPLAPSGPLPPQMGQPTAPVAAPGPTPPTPAPITAPVAAPVMAPPAPSAPAPIVSPINPPAPAHDFVNPPAPPAPVGPPVIAYEPGSNRPIYAYSAPDANGKVWPVYGYDANGGPIFA